MFYAEGIAHERTQGRSNVYSMASKHLSLSRKLCVCVCVCMCVCVCVWYMWYVCMCTRGVGSSLKGYSGAHMKGLEGYDLAPAA
jgi:hypothetical protein